MGSKILSYLLKVGGYYGLVLAILISCEYHHHNGFMFKEQDAIGCAVIPMILLAISKAIEVAAQEMKDRREI